MWQDGGPRGACNALWWSSTFCFTSSPWTTLPLLHLPCFDATNEASVLPCNHTQTWQVLFRQHPKPFLLGPLPSWQSSYSGCHPPAMAHLFQPGLVGLNPLYIGLLAPQGPRPLPLSPLGPLTQPRPFMHPLAS